MEFLKSRYLPLRSSNFSLKIFETRRAVPGGPYSASCAAWNQTPTQVWKDAPFWTYKNKNNDNENHNQQWQQQQPTTNNQQPTTNNQPTTNKQQTANSKQQTANNKQQTTDNKQQTTTTRTTTRTTINHNDISTNDIRVSKVCTLWTLPGLQPLFATLSAEWCLLKQHWSIDGGPLHAKE